jgi:hypothetical protein
MLAKVINACRSASHPYYSYVPGETVIATKAENQPDDSQFFIQPLEAHSDPMPMDDWRTLLVASSDIELL